MKNRNEVIALIKSLARVINANGFFNRVMSPDFKFGQIDADNNHPLLLLNGPELDDSVDKAVKVFQRILDMHVGEAFRHGASTKTVLKILSDFFGVKARENTTAQGYIDRSLLEALDLDRIAISNEISNSYKSWFSNVVPNLNRQIDVINLSTDLLRLLSAPILLTDRLDDSYLTLFSKLTPLVSEREREGLVVFGPTSRRFKVVMGRPLPWDRTWFNPGSKTTDEHLLEQAFNGGPDIDERDTFSFYLGDKWYARSSLEQEDGIFYIRPRNAFTATKFDHLYRVFGHDVMELSVAEYGYWDCLPEDIINETPELRVPLTMLQHKGKPISPANLKLRRKA